MAVKGHPESLQTVAITAVDKHGNKRPAYMAICSNCQGSEFELITFGEGEQHNHIHCITCDRSYCQGGCDDPPELNNNP